MTRLEATLRMPVEWAYRAAQWSRRNMTTDSVRELTSRLVTRRDPAGRVVILDDVYPNPYGAWRAAEFHAYLDAFPAAEVHVDGNNIRAGGWDKTRSQALRMHGKNFPQYRQRVRPFVGLGSAGACGFYCLFLNGIDRFLPFVESQRAPFVFTLYPGGGFRLNDAQSDAKLKRAFASPWFRGVIATQHVTYDYLVTNQFVPESDVQLIWGAVMPAQDLVADLRPRLADKPTFDISFIAHKYMPGGIDKGYDTFVKVADLLADRIPNATFHVIGPFGPEDCAGGRSYDRFRFHGTVPAARLPELLPTLDLVLSPNVPFRLASGSFDGFPTGGCVQAGLAGVPVFCTDVLGENREFEDGRDIVIVPPDAEAIAEAIFESHRNVRSLRTIGESGRGTFQDLYSYEKQVLPRVASLKGLLALPSPPGRKV